MFSGNTESSRKQKKHNEISLLFCENEFERLLHFEICKLKTDVRIQKKSRYNDATSFATVSKEAVPAKKAKEPRGSFPNKKWFY